MGFFDKLKDMAGDAGDAISKGAKNVSDSSKKMVEKTKIKNKISKLEEDIEKIKTDRLEYGYDSLCLRIDQLVNELAEMAYMLKGRSEGNDIAHYKRFYGMRAMRNYEILDDLLDGKGHTDHGKHV